MEISVDLRNIEIFVEIVKSGSFSKAARSLKIPTSQVSRRLKELEKELDTLLIERTTRKFKVTEIGKQYYQKCAEGIDRVTAANDLIDSYKGEPQGLLKIVGPNELTMFLSKEFLGDFLNRYAKINVEILQKDRAEPGDYFNFDIILEIGVSFAPQTFKQKILTKMRRQLYASPGYSHSKPKSIRHPKDLPYNDLIGFYSVRGNISATNTHFVNNVTNEEFSFPKANKINISNLSSMKNLALQGKFIAAVPEFVVEEELKSGNLVNLLPEWSTQEIPILAVFDANRSSSPKVRAFLDDLAVYLGRY